MPIKYLYGAAIQGIQGFIFQTNELQDIIGASELVKQICDDLFKDLFEEIGITYHSENAILKAAGNIKYIFDNEEDCKKIVLSFPKKVMTFAPGITISQAVVSMNGPFKDSVDLLEERLRIQRNKAVRNMTLGLTGIQRSRTTGLPVSIKKGNEYLDAPTHSKRANSETDSKLCDKCFGAGEIKKRQLAYNIKDITGQNNWIAVIHADGNGLGKIVQAIGRDENAFKDFSEKLDEATTNAARKAFEEIKPYFKDETIIPIRPVVLGGDDFTAICRGEFAVPYAAAFLEAFEEETYQRLSHILKDASGIKFDRLTACAGIAFIKSNYPFYYGYDLAESLCERAKKDAKKQERLVNGLAQSSLMFHKVQDSFVEEFSDIVERELTPQKDVSWEFGPYYLHDQNNADRWTIATLLDQIQQLDRDENHSIKSHLRRWMSEMHYNSDSANEIKNRMIQNFPDHKDMIETMLLGNHERDDSDSRKYRVYPVYDLLVLNTVMNQKTNG